MRNVLRAVLAIAVVLLVVTARAVYGGESELAASNEALLRGDAREATTRARIAAQYYVPGAPHVAVAYQRLLALGREADTRRLDADAAFAFNAVRTACLSTRWIVVPHPEALDEANRALAAIEARAPRPPAHADDPPAKLEREMLAKLATPLESRVAIHATVTLAIVLMVAGAIIALRRADATGRLPWGRARLGAAIALAGVALWVGVLVLA